MEGKNIVKIVACAACALGVIATIRCATIVRPGYGGVVYRLNGGVVENKVLGQGLHFVHLTENVRKYTVAQEQGNLSKDEDEGSDKDESFDVPTKDGKTVNVDLEFAYHFDGDNLPRLYTKYKGRSSKDIENTIIRGKIKAWAGEATANFSVLDIYGSKRAEVNASALKHVKEKLLKESEGTIVIDTLNFSRIGVDEQTAKAIQESVTAKQQLEKKKTELEAAQIEKKKAIVDAEAKAETVRIGAEAEANANKLKQESVTDTIVKYETQKKWDGKLPVATGESIPMLNIPQVDNKEKDKEK